VLTAWRRLFNFSRPDLYSMFWAALSHSFHRLSRDMGFFECCRIRLSRNKSQKQNLCGLPQTLETCCRVPESPQSLVRVVKESYWSLYSSEFAIFLGFVWQLCPSCANPLHPNYQAQIHYKCFYAVDIWKDLDQLWADLAINCIQSFSENRESHLWTIRPAWEEEKQRRSSWDQNWRGEGQHETK